MTIHERTQAARYILGIIACVALLAALKAGQ
jgi:hypothetical protein